MCHCCLTPKDLQSHGLRGLKLDCSDSIQKLLLKQIRACFGWVLQADFSTCKCIHRSETWLLVSQMNVPDYLLLLLLLLLFLVNGEAQ